MAIGTTAAILGSAIIGAGASALSSKSATNKAVAASENATDQSTAVQNRALDLQQSNTATQREVGDKALNALADRFGLSTPTAQESNAPASDWGAYLAQNPDVAEYFQNHQAELAAQGVTTPEQFAQKHYQEYGQSEGRSLPTVQAAAAPAPTGSAALVDNTGNYTVSRPTVAPAPTYNAPTYRETPIAPLDISLASYQQSPDYQYQLDQGNKNILTAGAATGTLGSGAALKALQKFGQDLALGDYSQWRDYTTGQYSNNRAYTASQDAAANSFNTTQANNQFAAANNTYQYGTSLGQNLYNSDRDYNTGQYNANTNALLGLAGQGATATGALNNAIGANANALSNLSMSNANTQGNAALANAGLVNNALGTGVNALAYYYGNQGQGGATGGSGTGTNFLNNYQYGNIR